jgi:FkbM family methyltransferase
VKVRAIAHLLGLRPRPAVFGSEIRCFNLSTDGLVEYAQWLHPAETPKTITQEAVDALRSFVRPGDLVIDIGAHTGDTAIPMALATGPTGCVLALEPNPYVFPVLERNASLNAGKTNIRPLNFAATPETGVVAFEYSDAGYCNGGRHAGISKWRHGHAFVLHVQGRNLQDYLRREAADLIPRLRYVKVDAEGSDLDVLRSIEDLLAETRPFVRAEIFGSSPRHRRVALVDFLRRLGYDLCRVSDGGEYFGPPVEPADVIGGAQFDVFAVPSTGAGGRPDRPSRRGTDLSPAGDGR